MTVVRWKSTEVPTDMPLQNCRRTQTSLAVVESLAMPRVQEVVFLADFRCGMCQKRVAEVMSKMNGETQTVVIGVMDKKVTLTCCTYPTAGHKLNLERRQSSWRKASPIARLFCSSSPFTDN